MIVIQIFFSGHLLLANVAVCLFVQNFALRGSDGVHLSLRTEDRIRPVSYLLHRVDKLSNAVTSVDPFDWQVVAWN